jgi:DNA-binding MarR family transcriptional regulator
MEADNYLYNNSAAAEEQFDQEDDERDEVVILREQCEFLAQRLQSMEATFYLYNNSAAAEEQFDQEDDERDEVVILREQCEFLAQRLQSMEATFQSLTPNQRPSTSPVRSTRDINHFPIQEEEEYRDDSELDDAESNKPGLTFTLKEIKGTLARLDGVFTSDDEDSELKLGNTAVTQIGKIVRGWLVRCKYKRLKTALRRWRRRRTKPIRREFVRIVRRRRVIDSGVELMITTRNINCKKNHFEAWQKRTKELLPLRIQQRAATKKMRKKLRDKFLRKICVRWWTIANGPSSRKSIALKNRMRMEEAHERITKRREQRKLPKSLITKEMLREEMGMEATRLIQTLKTLEEKKLIERRANPNDGRSVLIYLTERGKVNRDVSRVAVLKFNQAIKDDIGEEAFENFHNTIEKINNLIKNKKVFNF